MTPTTSPSDNPGDVTFRMRPDEAESFLRWLNERGAVGDEIMITIREAAPELVDAEGPVSEPEPETWADAQERFAASVREAWAPVVAAVRTALDRIEPVVREVFGMADNERRAATIRIAEAAARYADGPIPRTLSPRERASILRDASIVFEAEALSRPAGAEWITGGLAIVGASVAIRILTEIGAAFGIGLQDAIEFSATVTSVAGGALVGYGILRAWMARA